MKILTLIRHAKSSWDHPDLSDFDRPLNSRGEKNAPMMGRWLAEQDFAPDLILSSPAKRALTTAQILTHSLSYAEDAIQQEPMLYDAALETLLKIVQKTDSDINHLALVAHNPGLTEMANHLGSQFIDNLPTCGVLTLELPMSHWTDIHKTTGKTVRVDFPKKVKPLLK